MGQSDAYYFVCPECTQRIEVNESMRAALIENGCVVCGAGLTEAAFSSSGDGGE